jgi:outer membrane protein assembly factor BamB
MQAILPDRSGIRSRPAIAAGGMLTGGLLTVLFACLLAGSLPGVARAEPAWTTYHRDPGRSGDDPDATQPIAPVPAWQTENLGAPIWGQPLVLGERVYVATVGDEIYALEASSGKVIWQQSAGTPVPSGELPCGDITPTVGIVGTPVIDTSTGTIYAVADTWIEVAPGMHEVQHVLKGYKLSDGEEVRSVRVDPPGSDPRALLQRTALNLDRGEVIFGFGGNDGDCSDYRGTVVAAPESGGAPRFWQYSPAAPSKSGGAVWGPSGPAVDGAGNVYASTGNPNPEGGPAKTYDYSDSLLKLNPAQDFVAKPNTESAAPLGWFEPPTWLEDSNNDTDLGSAGPELLPGGLLFQAGKNGTGYLIDEATMGSGAPAVYSEPVCGGAGSFGGDAYANGVIYVACADGTRALAYDETAREFSLLWHGPEDAFGPPIVSGGLVWTVATGEFEGGGTKLYGLDPATGKPRYTETLPSPVADHFASPSAAGGRLFVSTGESVAAYQIAQVLTGGPGCSEETRIGLACPPGESTGSPGATTFAGGSPPGTSPSAKASSVPTLLHTHLRANARGRIHLALRCPATASECKGTITLLGEITVVSRLGKRRARRVVAIALARVRFGPSKGEFAITLRLSHAAEAHLRRHNDRLVLQVVIASPGNKARRVAAVLT